MRLWPRRMGRMGKGKTADGWRLRIPALWFYLQGCGGGGRSIITSLLEGTTPENASGPLAQSTKLYVRALRIPSFAMVALRCDRYCLVVPEPFQDRQRGGWCPLFGVLSDPSSSNLTTFPFYIQSLFLVIFETTLS